jgi:molybdopterin/thiamine biosynthesis adenylyltransferase
MPEFETIWEEFQNTTTVISPRQINRIPNHLNRRGAVFAFEGEIYVEGQTVLLQVGLDQDFPRSLPLVFLFPWNVLGLIPHVDKCGKVCYAQEEGLLLNRYAPVAIIEEAIERSLHTLVEGIRRENKLDFVKEFESYWACLDGVKKIPAAIEPSTRVQKITAIIEANADDSMPICLISDPGTPESYLNLNPSSHYTHHSALYVPFEKGVFIEPPPSDGFWNPSEIQAMVRSGLSHKNYKILCRLAEKHVTEHSVVFCLPRPSGNVALFGIHFTGVEQCSPLIPGGTARGGVPFVLDRRDNEYLLPRGGANLQLRQRRVAVLGCGSVGGFLSLELARSGIQDLTLVDPDNFCPENSFRHVLGRSSWHKPKVQALKEEIEDKIPYAQIQVFLGRGEELIQRGDLRLKDYDLIISAIGDDTVNLHLNQLLHDRVGAPPIIFTWLEPYGIGGHALLTGESRTGGCLECLFTPTLGDHDYYPHNRAAFAAEDQFFGESISGCSDLFTPYGSRDAVRTVTLAMSLVIDTLLERESGNPLISWKGYADDFLRAGFRLSKRYFMSEQQISDQRYDYKVASCPICGHK